MTRQWRAEMRVGLARLVALLGPLLEVDGAPLSEARRGYIDAVGNGNGGYDVGDVRRWLRERGPE